MMRKDLALEAGKKKSVTHTNTCTLCTLYMYMYEHTMSCNYSISQSIGLHLPDSTTCAQESLDVRVLVISV